MNSSIKVKPHDLTLIGVVSGVRFYEHPYKLDEASLCIVDTNGNLLETEFWDLPSIDEVSEQYLSKDNTV